MLCASVISFRSQIRFYKFLKTLDADIFILFDGSIRLCTDEINGRKAFGNQTRTGEVDAIGNSIDALDGNLSGSCKFCDQGCTYFGPVASVHLDPKKSRFLHTQALNVLNVDNVLTEDAQIGSCL